MTVHIEPKHSFLGVPLIKARDVLRAWRHARSGDAGLIAQTKQIALPPHVVRSLIHEFKVRGLIGPDLDNNHTPFTLTHAGESFATAKATARIARAAAAAKLAEFQKALDRASHDPDYPYIIDTVWLFGSMAKPEKMTIGDIDIAIGQTLKPDFANRDAVLEKASARGYQGASGDLWAKIRGPIDFLERVILFEGRRPPWISLTDIDTLIALAEPCRLIFDAKQGGRVDRPLLPKHPKAAERSSTAYPPPKMPPLSARSGLTLPDLSLTTPWLWRYPTCLQEAPQNFDSAARNLCCLPVFPAETTQYQRRASADPLIGQLADQLPVRLSCVLMCPAGSHYVPAKEIRLASPVLLAVERSIKETVHGAAYSLHLNYVAGGSKAEQARLAPDLAPILEFLVHADIAHAKLLLGEAGRPTDVKSQIACHMPDHIGAPLMRSLKLLRQLRVSQ